MERAEGREGALFGLMDDVSDTGIEGIGEM